MIKIDTDIKWDDTVKYGSHIINENLQNFQSLKSGNIKILILFKDKKTTMSFNNNWLHDIITNTFTLQ